MKTIAYFPRLVLFSILLIGASCSQNGEFSLLDGQKKSLDDYKGQWLLVNFWAEWCAPCLEEIPAINQFAHLNEPNDVRVLGVSYEPLSNHELKALVDQWDIQYPMIATDPVPVLPFSLPPTLPTSYLIDPSGKLVKRLVGLQNLESLTKVVAEAKKAYKK